MLCPVSQDAGKQLLYACVHNLPTSVVEDTLTANPDLDINAALACANDQGLTPLGAAAMAPQAASTPVLELLVRAGADVDLQDHMGESLSFAPVVAYMYIHDVYCYRSNCNALGCAV